MLSILTHERFAPAGFAPERPRHEDPRSENREPENLGMDAMSIEDMRRNQAVDESSDYEFVLGRRQVASISFVALVVVSVFVGISYLAGKSAGSRKEASQKIATPSTLAAPVLSSSPRLAAAEPALVPPVEQKLFGSSGGRDAKIFAEPLAGAIYIQTGAVERGVAGIMAEGLRAHGFNAFVAAGPNERVYRVLLGPFPSTADYRSARATLDELGLSAFAQQFQTSGSAVTANTHP